VQDRWRFEVLAGCGGARKNKDPGANDGADAQGGQRPWAEGFFEAMAFFVRLGKQFVDGFAAEKLIRGTAISCLPVRNCRVCQSWSPGNSN